MKSEQEIEKEKREKERKERAEKQKKSEELDQIAKTYFSIQKFSRLVEKEDGEVEMKNKQKEPIHQPSTSSRRESRRERRAHRAFDERLVMQ
jgi:hypothetical protein